jgi:hypothetical protein
VLGEVAWGGKDNTPRSCQPPCLQACVRQVADSDREVNSFAHKIDKAIRQFELDFDPR